MIPSLCTFAASRLGSGWLALSGEEGFCCLADARMGLTDTPRGFPLCTTGLLRPLDCWRAAPFSARGGFHYR